ncbi:response regulator [Pseudomonas schmalbachii]|uniref:Response regulator transcription factor n=1 Tax=Pseudomonas schmalbachii TaxID=2816993 RepID=A0ABS3TWU4_9PSED|nr:response regulator transcription factor [Pseudomonas schmalbachii]MBO3278125.1 response regulator transcription factor [Pseudomonas schmalbachii]
MSRILIVDDHPVVCMAVTAMLEKEGHTIVGTADNGVDALYMTKELLPDLVILDIGIPKLQGLEVISRMTQAELPVRVLVLSSLEPSLFAMRSLEAGAAGFISKQSGLADLMGAVNAILSGYDCFPVINGRSLCKREDDDILQSLSDKEIIVLQYLASGFASKEIAEQMLISIKTVSTYKTRLLKKLRMKSLVDIVDFAKRNAVV